MWTNIKVCYRYLKKKACQENEHVCLFKSIRTFNVRSLRNLMAIYVYLKVGHFGTKYAINTLKFRYYHFTFLKIR